MSFDSLPALKTIGLAHYSCEVEKQTKYVREHLEIILVYTALLLQKLRFDELSLEDFEEYEEMFHRILVSLDAAKRGAEQWLTMRMLKKYDYPESERTKEILESVSLVKSELDRWREALYSDMEEVLSTNKNESKLANDSCYESFPIIEVGKKSESPIPEFSEVALGGSLDSIPEFSRDVFGKSLNYSFGYNGFILGGSLDSIPDVSRDAFEGSLNSISETKKDALDEDSESIPEPNEDVLDESLKSIPTFTGDVFKFKNFLEIFNEVVHNSNLSDVRKLRFLRKCVSGDPFIVIQCYRSSEYEEAKLALEDQYGGIRNVCIRSEKLIEAIPTLTHCGDIVTFTSIVENVRGILQIVNDYRLGIYVEKTFFYMFRAKLPENVSKEFSKRIDLELPVMEDYLKHLENELKFARQISVKKSSDLPKEKKTPLSRNKDFTKDNKKDNSEQLVNSKNIRKETKKSIDVNHSRNRENDDTGKVHLPEGKTVQELVRLVIRAKACFICLSKGHLINECPYKEKCVVCNKLHHFRLCFKNKKPTAKQLKISQDVQHEKDCGPEESFLNKSKPEENEVDFPDGHVKESPLKNVGRGVQKNIVSTDHSPFNELAEKPNQVSNVEPQHVSVKMSQESLVPGVLVSKEIIRFSSMEELTKPDESKMNNVNKTELDSQMRNEFSLTETAQSAPKKKKSMLGWFRSPKSVQTK